MKPDAAPLSIQVFEHPADKNIGVPPLFEISIQNIDWTRVNKIGEVKVTYELKIPLK